MRTPHWRWNPLPDPLRVRNAEQELREAERRLRAAEARADAEGVLFSPALERQAAEYERARRAARAAYVGRS
jgi:hypothetical protein